ncbi:unnamed protein product [Blepharisma stoltei]|uniref:SKP1-like protein n=1 Tax=Blepharisma stoltei TaxID=1481888 RepID=A0AAU9IXZ2_9CILI|nr:unnamed protein product [Blepharisma stoltei]
MEEDKVKLRSQEDQIFEIEESAAFKSQILRSMIEGFDGKEEISLPIKAAIIEKILLYLKHYKDLEPPVIEKPLRTANLEEILPAWDVDFLNLETEMIFELILAANFLCISPLLDLLCAKLASLLKDKTSEEIRSAFHIKNDFTPEEEAKIREENLWAEME